MVRNVLIAAVILVVVLAIGYFVLIAGRQSDQNQNKANQNQNPNQPEITQSIPITIQNMSFTPGAITIPAGTTVVWTNRDTVAHTVSSETFSSPALNTGQTFEHKFDTKGIFTYICSIHPNMKGTVTVQ